MESFPLMPLLGFEMRILISILILTASQLSFGQETLSLEEEVNSSWISSNYTAIIEAVYAALQEDPTISWPCA